MKTILLKFIEYGTYESGHWNPETHAAFRIEIIESEGGYHTEEIEGRLPRPIYDALRDKLDHMVIEI